jgi:hypothetical protein
MPLKLNEIVPGIVAYFDVSLLNRHSDLKQPASPTPRDGPFVCFAAVDGASAWAPISQQYRPERLLIKRAWRLGGNGAWISEEQYLNDGRTTYVGASQVFVEAAMRIDKCSAPNRPQVAPEGVAAIIAEVHKRRGNTLP